MYKSARFFVAAQRNPSLCPLRPTPAVGTIVVGKLKLTWAQASVEMDLLQKETKAWSRRQKLLASKEDDGTITKTEVRELRHSSKIANAVLAKMFNIVMGEKLP